VQRGCHCGWISTEARIPRELTKSGEYVRQFSTLRLIGASWVASLRQSSVSVLTAGDAPISPTPRACSASGQKPGGAGIALWHQRTEVAA